MKKVSLVNWFIQYLKDVFAHIYVTKPYYVYSIF